MAKTASNRVQSFYTQKAKLYQRFFVEYLQWENVLQTFFAEHRYLDSGMKILDAGCGTGSVTRVLHNLAQSDGLQNVTFHAFDLTPAMLDLFRQWVESEGAANIHLRQANVLDLEHQLPADWAGYDLIVSSAMLEYIPVENRSQALINLRRLLKDRGRLLLFLTKRTWIASWIGAKWWGTNLFDRDALQLELQQAGYTDIQNRELPSSWNRFMMAVEAEPVPSGA